MQVGTNHRADYLFIIGLIRYEEEDFLGKQGQKSGILKVILINRIVHAMR
jgi:hypothetical protein